MRTLLDLERPTVEGRQIPCLDTVSNTQIMKSNDDIVYPLTLAFDQLLGSERELVENVGPLFDRLKQKGVAPFRRVTLLNLFSSFLTYRKGSEG